MFVKHIIDYNVNEDGVKEMINGHKKKQEPENEQENEPGPAHEHEQEQEWGSKQKSEY